MSQDAQPVIESPQWIEISLCTPPELVEAIANFLIDEGSNGVVIEDVAPGDRFYDRRRMGWLWVRAYFPTDEFAHLEARLHTYLDEVATLFPLSEPPVLDQSTPEVADWNVSWKKFFQPIQISERIMVRPSWESGPVPPGITPVILDPGIAFGTGKHPSTKLCIRALESEVLFPSDDRPPRKVFSLLDVGTGSGILALAAGRLGVPRVLGIDVDAQAVASATNNVARNSMKKQVEISDEHLEDLIERFDVVIANIVAETLLANKQHLIDRLAPDGVLILSGLLRNQGAWIKDEFLDGPLTFVGALHEDDWCALVFERI
ncbi:MAG: 50S ribosomal protein L11 methyltransferase [Candidatus Dadabacteria bacterium]|nr:MAG: 50S ribosomal protein L11 methyltransferase [Candidatus Dadabacteria bacterium]